MRSFFLLLVSVILVSGCSATPPQATSTEVTQSVTRSASTAAIQSTTSAYPSPIIASPVPTQAGYPAQNTDEPTLVVTQDPTKGTVSGTIHFNSQPNIPTDLYLSGMVSNAKGTEVAAGLDRIYDPKTTSDNQGKFTFWNVPPGRYVLLYYNHPQAALLLDQKTHMAIYVTVAAGKTVDLGTMTYDNPPQ